MTIECRVVDAGARYGLHPTWEPLKGIAEFHLFEMDADEAERLSGKYAGTPGITVHPMALYSHDTELSFKVHAHHGLNSIKTADRDVLKRNDYWVDQYTVEEERTVPARALDSLFAGTAVHFLKLDVEGAELDLLRGATAMLTGPVLGIRSETTFLPVYRNAPLFGDLHAFLLDHGFELLNLDYDGRGNAAGRFSAPGRYGKLVSTDAVWIANNDRLHAGQGDERAADLIRAALFLTLNHAPDLAVDLLSDAVEKGRLDPASWQEDAVFQVLYTRLLGHLKQLSGLPMFRDDGIDAVCRTLFGHPFPALHRYHEGRHRA